MLSKWNDFPFKRAIDKRAAYLLAAAAFLSAFIYLLSAYLEFRIGYPLDDAWIHQTYARNLALWGEWSFWRGATSGGSTAPLWSALLALGYWLKIHHFLWTFFLGGAILWALALVSETFMRKLVPAYQAKLPLAGFFMLGEWHLVWASLSGMETLLYALILSFLLLMLAAEREHYLLYGALIGISLWIRPGGLTLLGPVLVFLFIKQKSRQSLLRALFNLLLSFGVFLALYFLFNLAITGTPLPNTFYAKQAEYISLLQRPLWQRILEQLSLPLRGAGLLLLPGTLYFGWHAFRERKVGILVGGVWFIGYAAIYALKLPVTYQHGRYLIPAMPLFFFWGLAGILQAGAALRKESLQKLRNIWQFALVLIWGAFYGLGARAYAQDVAFIESEMVQTAHWVSQNIPAESLIAAHDIGALGYFASRPILDLAGLISPEVIPFLRNEEKLRNYLTQNNVEYLIVFPTWYDTLSVGLPLVYNTNGPFTPQIGGENMAIYQWTH